MDQPARERWWRERGRRVGLRVNVGWWVSAFVPWLLVSGLAGACALVLFRLQQWPLRAWALLFGGTLCLGATVGLLRCRRRLLSAADGLVRLEDHHRLHNRLTAAAHGIGDWPEALPEAKDGLRWDLPRCLARPAATFLVLVAAALVPVRQVSQATTSGLEEPLSWGEVESWVDALEEEAILEEEPLGDVREQVSALRARPMQEWYSHSSLEAGDNLREQTAGSMRTLERDLQTAVAGLGAVEQFSDSVPAGLADTWTREMGEALEGLEFGALNLDRELLEQLKALNLDGPFRALTPEELATLKEALARGLQACQGCLGSGTNAVVALAAACGQWGRGGITRGPGEAPMLLNEKETRLGGGKAEALANPDYRRAAIGDTMAVQDGQHEMDESLYRQGAEAGAAASLGEGGEAVWTTPLVPEEQDVLTRYFK